LGDEHLLSSWLAVESHAIELSLHGDWSWAQVLVWVESTEGGHLSEAGDLDQGWWLVVQWAELEWGDGRAVAIEIVVLLTAPVLVVVSIVVVLVLGLVVISDLLWHWWQSDTLWKIWEWVDQISLLSIVMEE
jgi:hypothetical protein